MDVANIPCVDQAFDAVYCSHVLEHVPDDKRAMREFCRVMKQGGWAILLVPVDGPTTFEDPTIVTPAERMKFFGQADHVRRYGEDFPGRLREAGFTVEVVSAQALVNDADAVAMGLTPASGVIYYCKKC
jgi:SAM-dependent methyltransferase